MTDISYLLNERATILLAIGRSMLFKQTFLPSGKENFANQLHCAELEIDENRSLNTQIE